MIDMMLLSVVYACICVLVVLTVLAIHCCLRFADNSDYNNVVNEHAYRVAPA